MSEYVIQGGRALAGEVKAGGNKNAALPCIAAAILSEEEVVLRNIPDIADVCVMLEIAQSLGAHVEKRGEGVWSVHAAKLTSSKVPHELSSKIRASLLFAGSLLSRTGRALMYPPGGDVIGRRRLDTHFLALSSLGAVINSGEFYEFKSEKLKGADIFLDEASVTATENAVMAAVLAEGKTVITNAASEPHVQDLCNMLNSMGAKISGIASNILHIEGVSSLSGTDFTIGADYMEVGSFIGLAAATGGEIKISALGSLDMRPLAVGFRKLGISWEEEDEGDAIRVGKNQRMKVVTDDGEVIARIDDSPWPAFPPDLTSIMTVVATQVEGTTLIFEKMFESRMYFVDKLVSMAAAITLCDPHRALVVGKSRLFGAVLTSPDIRAGMAMVIAALAAEGESRIKNIYQIERGYENLVERLVKLGADIKKVEE